MQMTFRWYGEGNDSITPEMIKQIPGVTGLVWALHDKQAGEVWEVEEIEKARQQIEGAGFNMDVVESVNVHDDIKIGLPSISKITRQRCAIWQNSVSRLLPTISCRFLTGREQTCSTRWKTAPPLCFMKKTAFTMTTRKWLIIS